ncbi:MAG: LysR family transcriptional regulator, partial [Acidimicrobiales bacterium]|nr:LysR family transcriptional regulator [Acidimicrobiales bacterium]
MDLRQLSYVVAVVDEGGMTRAAAAIGVAQPTLSQAIRSLEAELGVELFHRVGRTVQLSAAGAALVAPARAALRDAATARAAVAAVAGLEAGHLDLVSLPTLAVHPLAELIGRFRAAHPAVTVRLHEPDDPAAVERQVREGAAELGCTELPVAEDLVTVPLAEQEYVALVPSDRRSTVGRSPSVTMTDLARLPFITTPVGTSARRQLDERLAAAGVVATIAVETDHREAIAPLV